MRPFNRDCKSEAIASVGRSIDAAMRSLPNSQGEIPARSEPRRISHGMRGLLLAPALFRTILRRRRSVRRCGVGFLLLVLGRFLLRRLQLVDDLLQGGDGALQAFDLPIRSIELLLM